MVAVADMPTMTAVFITGPIFIGIYVGLRCSRRTARNGFAVGEMGGL